MLGGVLYPPPDRATPVFIIKIIVKNCRRGCLALRRGGGLSPPPQPPLETPLECAPSTTDRAQPDSMLRFSIALTIIFIFSLTPSMIPKIIPQATESLSIPSDRTRTVVLGAYSWMICRRNSFHDLQCSMVKKNNILSFSDTRFSRQKI